MTHVLRSSLALVVFVACTPLTEDGLEGSADSGSAEGNSAEGSSAEGEGGDEVPSNSFCNPVSDWDPSWSTFEAQILDIVNARRSEGANCGSMGSFGAAPALSMNGALRCAARVHSKQMVDMEFFDHVTPWGEEPWDRMEAAGYSYTFAGENIAAGNPTAEATMQQWMTSDGHCSNIMSPDFTEIGVGYFAGGSYGHMWTQAFGDR
jgi:uncharacterized protein YkwD